ncbi:MAG: hypothetical protein CFH01_01084 [Alphaproteobacteria bacterium MarineAlpha2_Bin1]|nr:MAG: hypothetical protein CFH01_01084 [Alphaproteobacteria bacterium MarineAlpha2_Bin1]|tara:strand:- start:38 stop:259 length:222 start_codon:yes stop_codon:yes gene_type:complete
MIPKRFSNLLFGLIVSAVMTLVVSGISTFNNIEKSEQFYFLWINSWVKSWVVAFPLILVVSPLTKIIILRITK